MTDRLDPTTLKWCAEEVETASRNYAAGRGDAFVMAVQAMRTLAAEAASRPPRLSDWVMAAEASCMRNAASNVIQALCDMGEWSGPREARLRFRIVDDTLVCDQGYVWDGFDGKPAGTATNGTTSSPAALTAALNALASEVPR